MQSNVEIYNEGRVVGYSAYEIYVKQHLSEDPDTPVASEREWLASSIAMGSSMLLKLPKMELTDEDTHGYIDIPLPSNSVLAAANTIVASFFDGDAAWVSASGITGTVTPTGGAWASRVTDYGQAITNVTSGTPTGTKTATQHNSVPRQTLEDWSQNKKDQLRDYMKIVDGIVIQPGTWTVNGGVRDFSAELRGSAYPTIRIHVKGSVTHEPKILFTGFTIRSVLLGTVGTAGTQDTPSYKDGDFLGPAIFPWSNKIVFSVPTSYIVYFASGAYKRQLPADSKALRVSDTPVIDMKSGSGDSVISATTLENYYDASKGSSQLTDAQKTKIAKLYSPSTNGNAYYTSSTIRSGLNSSRINDDVVDFTTLGDGTAVLTVYQKKYIYPPALYGTFVDSKGTEHLHPIDVVAPGSVKMFQNDDGSLMKDYEQTFPGSNSINKTDEGELEVLDPTNPDTRVKVAGLQIDYLSNNSSTGAFDTPRTSLTGTSRPRLLRIKTGKKSSEALMMSTNIASNLEDPTQLTVDNEHDDSGASVPGPANGITLTYTNSRDNLFWSALLDALRTNRFIDLLGTRLKRAKYTLKKPITGNATEGTSEADRKDTSKGSAYLEFGPDSAPIRLYICKEAPAVDNVPIGSIGIGWGFDYEE